MDFSLQKSPQLITRKIWVIEKSWNFHTVVGSLFWIWYNFICCMYFLCRIQSLYGLPASTRICTLPSSPGVSPSSLSPRNCPTPRVLPSSTTRPTPSAWPTTPMAMSSALYDVKIPVILNWIYYYEKRLLELLNTIDFDRLHNYTVWGSPNLCVIWLYTNKTTELTTKAR